MTSTARVENPSVKATVQRIQCAGARDTLLTWTARAWTARALTAREVVEPTNDTVQLIRSPVEILPDMGHLPARRVNFLRLHSLNFRLPPLDLRHDKGIFHLGSRFFPSHLVTVYQPIF